MMNAYELETGDGVDRIVQGKPYGWTRGAGAIIRPTSGTSIRAIVNVIGKLTCHGCGGELPFKAEVFPSGMGGSGSVKCSACGSVVNFSHASHQVGNVACQIFVAHPFIDPSSGAKSRIRFIAAAVEEVK